MEKIVVMNGEVGRLRAGERFYRKGYKLPYTVVSSSHRMGVQCSHPRQKGFSYLQPDRQVGVDLKSCGGLGFASRPLAGVKKG